MSAGLGDVLGATFVLMPHGIPTGVTPAPTPVNKGRHPVQLSIATGKPIDLLGLTDEELVEIAVALSGTVRCRTKTHVPTLYAERRGAGTARAMMRAGAAMSADRVGGGTIRASLRMTAGWHVANDDLETLYLLGVI